MHSAPRWRRLPLGPRDCLFPFIRHCENIPLGLYSFISHLLVCLLIILLLEQNMQWMMRFFFCEKPRVYQEQGDQPRAHEEGT